MDGHQGRHLEIDLGGFFLFTRASADTMESKAENVT